MMVLAMDGPNCALYARVSTRDKQEPLTQLNPLRDYAQLRGYVIVAEYLDIGISGAKCSRPQLDRLMKDARQRKFDLILVQRFDRFGRSTSHLIRSLEEFKELGIDFVSLNESIDTSTAIGKFFYTVLGAFAEFERNIIIERIGAGLERARRQGKKLGRPRVGLDIESALRLRAEGLGVRRIAKEMGCSASSVHAALKACEKPMQP